MKGQELQVSELLGTAVRNTANESIGNINDVLLTKDGQIHSVIVGVGGFLGLGEKNVALKFSELQFDNSNPNEPKVTSTATSDALAASPEWKEPGSATGAGGAGGTGSSR
jgi:sporulation protein YlmC with PRC-barrel domain